MHSQEFISQDKWPGGIECTKKKKTASSHDTQAFQVRIGPKQHVQD